MRFRNGPLVAGGLVFLMTGCAVQKHLDLPPNANAMATGPGTLTYTATQPGIVAVGDLDEGAVLYRGHVATGDIVGVDPQHDRITINGQPVGTAHLKPAHQNQIDFYTDLSDQQQLPM